MNILYIHGLGSDKNTSTGKYLKQYFGEDNKVIVDTFELLDPQKMLVHLGKMLSKYKIDLIVASSLGAFYALNIGSRLPKVLFNPCMKPSNELPKLIDDLSAKTINKFQMLEKSIYNIVDAEDRATTYAAFAGNDELFSYLSFYKHTYKINFKIISGGHRVGNENIKKVLDEALPKLNFDVAQFTPIPMFESFINLIAGDSDIKKTKFDLYKQEVFDILELSYASIGGMLGVEKPDDLIEDSSFWKLDRRNGKIVSVCLYTMKRGGRKLTYCGTDGTQIGRESLTRILMDDIKRPERQAWVETSHALEKKMLRLEAVPIPAETVVKLLQDKQIIKIHPDGYHYDREIAGKVVTKIMFGTITI